MTEEQALVCEHGLRALELSAWRDGDLPNAETRRIGDHLAACPAARAHLDDYDADIAALRAQRVPAADQRLWQRVSARAAAAPQRTPAALARRHPLAVGLGTVGTVAALLALVLGFARLLMPGPTSTPASYKGWTAATFPRGFTLDFDSLAVVDGTHAYACVTPLDQQQRQKPTVSGPAAQFWLTRDRGQTWIRQADLPIIGINQCTITVDDLNPFVVSIWGRAIPLHSGGLLAHAASATNDGYGAAITYDGGGSWRQPSLVAGSTYSVLQHATLGTATYALICCDAAGGGDRLIVSRDFLATWQPIDGAIVAAGQQVAWFAVTPATGAISASAIDNTAPADARQHLWESSDGGADWVGVSSPAASTYDLYVAQQPAGNETPQVCIEAYPLDTSSASAPHAAPTALYCSFQGANWQLLSLPPRAICASSLSLGPRLKAIAANGDVFMDDGGCTDTLYRLPAGGDTWQAVASAPTTRLDLAYYPATGVIWTMPRLADAYTQIDPTGRVYTKPLAP
jgi:hypothetical protein